MRGFAKALCDFWGGLGLPVYRAEGAPDGAKLPYMTLKIACPAPLGEETLTADLWLPGGDAGEKRAAWTDKIADALPWEGTRLDTDRGFLLLYPEALEWDADRTDRETVRCRVRYRARYYGR